MKNKIITLLCLVIFTIACKKSETNMQSESIQSISTKLSTDSNFTNIIKKEIELSNLIQNILIKKNIKADSLISKLSKLNNGNQDLKLIKASLNDLGEPFLYEYLKEFRADYNKKWMKLMNTYKSIPSNDINEACNKYFVQQSILNIKSDGKIISNGFNTSFVRKCGWSYSLCVAGVSAAAVLCHAGCVGATAGFGAPVCLLLCGTIQVSAGVQCMSSFCNP